MNDGPKTLSNLRLTPSSASFIEASIATASSGLAPRILAIAIVALVAGAVGALWFAAGGAILAWIGGEEAQAIWAGFLLLVSLPFALVLGFGVGFLRRLRS